MQRAGAAAATEIALRHADRLHSGVLVFAGPGNNGGDGWVVARALAASGVRVRAIEPIPAKTVDGRSERDLAAPHVATSPWSDSPDLLWGGETLVVDALLGTGSSGAPRDAIQAAVALMARLRERGATVVALDLPTGVDATTGDTEGAVTADLTVTFGAIKRGHLLARDVCGEIVVVDIGLEASASDDGTPSLVDGRWVAAHVPRMEAAAHKGTRKKLVICGGAEGMAGAVVLAARAALRSSIGMVRLVVDDPSVAVVQGAEPLALAARWPTDDAALERDVLDWADVVVIGPGLGRSEHAKGLLDRVLAKWRGPVVLDADALNRFAGNLPAMRGALGGRAALLTPHAGELGRLVGCDIADVLARRFEIAGEVAAQVGATVLLKGVPTIVADPSGRRLVSATGTPALAAAGSGDLLSGIAGTLLAQTADPLVAGAASAWIHGRAAEEASGIGRNVGASPWRRGRRSPELRVRGVTLDDVLGALPLGFVAGRGPGRYPVLLELPRVGDHS